MVSNPRGWNCTSAGSGQKSWLILDAPYTPFLRPGRLPALLLIPVYSSQNQKCHFCPQAPGHGSEDQYLGIAVLKAESESLA